MSKKQNKQITLKPGQTIEIGPSVKIEPEPKVSQQLRDFADDLSLPDNAETYRKIISKAQSLVTEPRRFMPRDCTQCLTRRKPGESYVRVYSKHGRIRYCRCSLCGNTWAQEGE